MAIHQIFSGSSSLRPLLKTSATAFQVCAAGAGNCVGAQHRGVGHQDAEAHDGHDGAHEDAGELGHELFPRICAQQIAALQIGQQVGGRSGGAGRDVGAHQVDVHVAAG